MSVVSAVVDQVTGLSGIAAYSLVGGLAFGESSLLVGFVLPGETAVLLGGVLAFRDAVSLPLMMVVAIAAAVLGDTVGYAIGTRFGPLLATSRLLARHQGALQRSTDLLQRHGGKAVLVARFTAFLRAVMPGIAGMARLPYRTFLTWNVAGAVVWAGGLTLLGYAAGNSYGALENWIGRGSVAVAIAVAVAVLALLIRRRVSGTRTPSSPPPVTAD